MTLVPLLHVRASALPLAVQCVASQRDDWAYGRSLITERPAGPEARLGSAVHECLRLHVEGLDYDAQAIARRWDVDAAEVRQLAAKGRRCWEAMRPYFGDPSCYLTEAPQLWEDKEARILLTGHVDLLSYLPGDIATLADWKTGQVEPDAIDQLRAYAWLVLQDTPDVSEVWAWLVLVREGEAVRWVWTRAELADWWQGFAARLRGPITFTPGGHCAYCRRQATCEARIGWLRCSKALVTTTVGALEFGLSAPTLAELVPLLEGIKALEVFCENARSVIKGTLEANGGVVRHGEREMRLREVETRRLDYAAGAQVLAQWLPPERLPEVLSVNKSKCEEIIHATSPRGHRQSNVKEFLAQLESVGAIKSHFSERLEIRYVPSNDTKPAALGNGGGAGQGE